MTKLVVTEVNNQGVLLSVFTELPEFWSTILPAKGESILNYWDTKSNLQLTILLEQVAQSSIPIETSLTIALQEFQLTAHRHQDNHLFIYWKFIENVSAKNIKQEIVDFAFMKASIPILLVYANGSFFDFNEAALALYGYTRDELMRLNVVDLNAIIEGDFRLRWVEVWQEMKKKQKVRVQSKNKTKDERLIDIEIVANYIEYEGIGLNCSFITDITEKKKLEEQLELIDFAFRNAGVGMHFIQKDGLVIDFNTRAHNLLGYTKEEYQALNIIETVPKYDTKKSWDKRWEEYRMQKELHFSVTLKKKDGNLIEADFNANLINFQQKELLFASFVDVSEHKKREERLNLVDFAFKKSAVAIFFTREDASFFDFNDAALSMYGYTKDEMEELKVDDLTAAYKRKDVPNAWTRLWAEMKVLKTIVFTSKHQKKDRTIIDVEIRVNYIEYEGVQLNCAFIVDITDKMRTEEALWRSIERYYFATLATSDVIWETDLITNTLFLSYNFTSIFGHETPSEQPMQNSIWQQNVHPDDLQRIQDSENEALGNLGDRWHGEYRFRKADGNYASVLDRSFAIKDELGKTIKIIGSMQDITQQKLEEERLKLFEAVITNTTDGVIIADATKGADLPILYVNEAYTRMTGYSFEDVKGKHPNILKEFLTQDTEREELKAPIKNYSSIRVELINYRKNGEQFWCNVSMFPVADKTGKYTHWISIQRDVTNRKSAEQEKEHLLNELILSNKELKQFSYITTHNLRAPLTNLISICRILKTETIADPLTLQLIDGFKKSTYQLNETLNDLIDVLIIKENPNLPIGQVSISETLDKVTTSIANTIAKVRATIETDFSSVNIISFNSSYLESILLNLLTNSLKYAHPERKPAIKVISKKGEDGAMQLIFSDNGIGMDLNLVKDRIFGLYQRFHNNADSKGVGLYLIHSQIIALGGKIEVASEVNIGTTFTITFKKY